MASARFPHVRLGHMLDEIDAIISATRGIAAEAVMADYLTTRAVERAIQIVSEAAKELPPGSAGAGAGRALAGNHRHRQPAAARVLPHQNERDQGHLDRSLAPIASGHRQAAGQVPAVNVQGRL